MSENIKIGQKFGAWLVQKKLNYKQKYQCLCTACGKTIQNIRRYDLTHNKTRMCKQCATQTTRSSHGMSHTTEYNTWSHIIQRCHNPKNKDYSRYGGRGIEVHPMWRESFEAFYMYIGPKPTPGHTIERLDYNKGYEPGNVMWATRAEQNLNKSDNVNITIAGVTKTVSEWSRDPRCSVSSHTIYKRITRGWLDKFGAEYTIFSAAQ